MALIIIAYGPLHELNNQGCKLILRLHSKIWQAAIIQILTPVIFG